MKEPTSDDWPINRKNPDARGDVNSGEIPWFPEGELPPIAPQKLQETPNWTPKQGYPPLLEEIPGKWDHPAFGAFNAGLCQLAILVGVLVLSPRVVEVVFAILLGGLLVAVLMFSLCGRRSGIGAVIGTVVSYLLWFGGCAWMFTSGRW